jgi:hypothetical protein
MKKRILRIVGIIFLLALAGGIYYIHLLTPVITGYAAKNLASGVFVGNRTQESIESTRKKITQTLHAQCHIILRCVSKGKYCSCIKIMQIHFTG